MDIPVTFTHPPGKPDWGFPMLKGPGRMRAEQGRLVLEGRVFGLTSLWLKLGAPLGFLAIIPLLLWFEMVGVWLGLGGIVALVGYDFYQRKTGREYRLKIPPGCGYRIETAGEQAWVTLQLDGFVVGEGSRPPVVAVELPAAHVGELKSLLHRG